MHKVAIGAVLVLGLAGLAGCGNAPPPTAAAPPRYTIVSERAAAGGALTVNVKMTGPASEAQAKTVAEDVINKRRAQYGNITVTTYSESGASANTPYSTSTFDGRTISHKFNGQAEDQRIATH
jgi:ABC-type glycerol-3-phosphate transport system substrate-binding protein